MDSIFNDSFLVPFVSTLGLGLIYFGYKLMKNKPKEKIAEEVCITPCVDILVNQQIESVQQSAEEEVMTISINVPTMGEESIDIPAVNDQQQVDHLAPTKSTKNKKKKPKTVKVKVDSGTKNKAEEEKSRKRFEAKLKKKAEIQVKEQQKSILTIKSPNVNKIVTSKSRAAATQMVVIPEKSQFEEFFNKQQEEKLVPCIKKKKKPVVAIEDSSITTQGDIINCLSAVGEVNSSLLITNWKANREQLIDTLENALDNINGLKKGEDLPNYIKSIDYSNADGIIVNFIDPQDSTRLFELIKPGFLIYNRDGTSFVPVLSKQ